jgi:hypothetical protein
VKLEILGFLYQGALVEQFVTNENASNSALVQARFTSNFPVAVPEPSDLLLVVTGLLALPLARGASRRTVRSAGPGDQSRRRRLA